MTRGYRDEDDDRDRRDDDNLPLWRFTSECIRETAEALLVQFTDGSEQWFPKSVIHNDSEVYELGCDGTIVVQGWFAKKKGLCPWP